MEIGTIQPQFTTILSNEVLARVEHLRLNASRRFTNRQRGEHLSGKGGSSTDFSDYRDYAPGDDVRYVDWNIFSRLRRPYIKLYHQEEEMHVVVLIDASSSMLFEDKLDRAKQLAAAFGVMGLFSSERVSVYAFNEPQGALPATGGYTGRGNMRKIFRFIEQIEGGGSAPLETGIDLLLKRHRGRGVIVVLSDFLTFGDLRRAFNTLNSAGLELFALQIMGPTELDPDVNGDLRLVDCETERTLDVSSASHLVTVYHEYLSAFQRKLEVLCRQRGGKFLTTNAADPIELVILDQLRRQGWVQ